LRDGLAAEQLSVELLGEDAGRFIDDRPQRADEDARPGFQERFRKPTRVNW